MDLVCHEGQTIPVTNIRGLNLCMLVSMERYHRCDVKTVSDSSALIMISVHMACSLHSLCASSCSLMLALVLCQGVHVQAALLPRNDVFHCAITHPGIHHVT